MKSPATCASNQSALDRRFPAISRHFPLPKRRKDVHEVRCSVINVEENLETMKYSAVGVEH